MTLPCEEVLGICNRLSLQQHHHNLSTVSTPVGLLYTSVLLFSVLVEETLLLLQDDPLCTLETLKCLHKVP